MEVMQDFMDLGHWAIEATFSHIALRDRARTLMESTFKTSRNQTFYPCIVDQSQFQEGPISQKERIEERNRQTDRDKFYRSIFYYAKWFNYYDPIFILLIDHYAEPLFTPISNPNAVWANSIGGYDSIFMVRFARLKRLIAQAKKSQNQSSLAIHMSRVG